MKLIELEESQRKKLREDKKIAQENLILENERLRKIKDEIKKKQAESDMAMIQENMLLIFILLLLFIITFFKGES